MSEYDVDNGGVIELSEFTLFIRNQAKEAERKLKVRACVCVCCFCSPLCRTP